ncbi:MAG: hypothetical protein R6V47_00155 [Candidatus Delongbacteria bacterium]
MNNKLLIVTHGEFGASIIDVARKIIGSICDECVFFLSNEGLSTSELSQKISEFIDTDPDSNYIIATDFPGGSCFIASKRVSSRKKNASTISGLNLSMLLSFLTKKDLYEGKKIKETMKTDGNRAIVT